PAGAAARAAPALALLADADLLTPPCPLHAPRPPCAAVVPSLHATGFALLSCAVETAGAAIMAATHIAPHITVLSFAIFMCFLPKATAGSDGGPFQGRQEYRNPRGGGISRQRSCSRIGSDDRAQRLAAESSRARERRAACRSGCLDGAHRSDHGHARVRAALGR